MDFEEKTLSVEPIYDGKIFKVRKEQVELPDGTESMRELISHPGGVGVIAENDGLYYMFHGDVTYCDAALYANKLSVVFESLSRKQATRARSLHTSARIMQHPATARRS